MSRSPRSLLRTVALAAVLLPATTGLAACGGSDDDDTAGAGAATAAASSEAVSTKDVTLRVGVQKDGVRSILEASGVLKDAPYKVKYSVFAFGPPLVEAAGADRIDVAGVGSTPPIFGAAGGQDFRVIATLKTRSDTEDSLLVPKGSDISDPKQLKGKRIAVPKGSSAHGFLLNLLRNAGLKQSDVKLVFLAPADGLAAFSSGDVDAWAVWQPFISQAESDGATDIANGAPNEFGNAFQIASKEALDDPARRAALADYEKRLAKAFAWAAKNQEAWAQAWTKESQLPLTTTRPAVPKVLADLTPVTDEVVQQQQDLADTLFEEKVIPGKVDFTKIIEPGVVTEAAPAS